MYTKGNAAKSYVEIPVENPGRAWCYGMVSGNGLNGYIESGAPYEDTFIFQNMKFIYPSPEPREIPKCLAGQVAEVRENVFAMNDEWVIKNENGEPYKMTFFYSFHPGYQLRLTANKRGNVSDYVRWTNYETGETGVKYTDKYGDWIRTSFTSREDNVSITRIEKSSGGEKIDMLISIDPITSMNRAYDERFKVTKQRYKKFVNEKCDYIARISHYPSHEGSELAEGGYGGVTRVITEGGKRECVFLPEPDGEMNVGDLGNPAIKITDADVVYLITESARTKRLGSMEEFMEASEYVLLDKLLKSTKQVQDKYTSDGLFDYHAALVPSARKQAEIFNRVSLELDDTEDYASADNDELIKLQQGMDGKINHEFLKRVYEQGRYAQICCSGTLAPKLCGMWIGEWNPPWCAVYTLDANVNLQVSAMNTGNLREMALGYIIFMLRSAPDFLQNAEASYHMHDAIQTSVNSDGDRAMHVQYDNVYPFQYWNAGASWCLLPIYEYWQCFGNTQIPILEDMHLEKLQKLLSPNDGGLTEEEFSALQKRGYLELDRDILLPLLTKQANFWEQLCTPEYYIGNDGNAHYEKGKVQLNPGEKYMLIPTYSPENHPIGYGSTITANATMDISAAKDGLKMTIEMEKAVRRKGYEQAVLKWEELMKKLPEYKLDEDGALCEWAMNGYEEQNNHRHISHLYCAWPAYETQHDTALATACKIAMQNRNEYNTNDDTAGHGWIHRALVETRLKRGDIALNMIFPMTNHEAFYPSLMTDHDSNRRLNAFCTDTLFGIVGIVNEMLLFSDSNEIELLPALPQELKSGSVKGLAARCRVIVKELVWNIEDGEVNARLLPSEDVVAALTCGCTWKRAIINEEEYQAGDTILLTLHKGKELTVNFKL